MAAYRQVYDYRHLRSAIEYGYLYLFLLLIIYVISEKNNL